MELMKPYGKYRYSDLNLDYDSWAACCAEEPGPPLLRQQDAVKMEHLYDDDASYTSREHQENIRFLQDLQERLCVVWKPEWVQEANMSSLVDDYKRYFGLEEKQ